MAAITATCKIWWLCPTISKRPKTKPIAVHKRSPFILTLYQERNVRERVWRRLHHLRYRSLPWSQDTRSPCGTFSENREECRREWLEQHLWSRVKTFVKDHSKHRIPYRRVQVQWIEWLWMDDNVVWNMQHCWCQSPMQWTKQWECQCRSTLILTGSRINSEWTESLSQRLKYWCLLERREEPEVHRRFSVKSIRLYSPI